MWTRAQHKASSGFFGRRSAGAARKPRGSCASRSQAPQDEAERLPGTPAAATPFPLSRGSGPLRRLPDRSIGRGGGAAVPFGAFDELLGENNNVPLLPPAAPRGRDAIGRGPEKTPKTCSQRGTWCSGITPAQHAGGPGFNPQRVHHGRWPKTRFRAKHSPKIGSRAQICNFPPQEGRTQR